MVDDVDDLTARITAAMHRGVQQARAISKALGLPMVIWHDGRVVHVDAETMQPVEWPNAKNEEERLGLPPQS